MSAKPAMMHGYVVHRFRAEQGDLKALHSFVAMIEGDLRGLSIGGNLPLSLRPLVGSLASEADRLKNFIWGFREGHGLGSEQARTRGHKRKKRRAA